MEEDGQNIEMLLILPIQSKSIYFSQILTILGIPRYNLLLEQLVKHTWAEHPDKAPLEEAYNTMKDVAAYVNEVKTLFSLSSSYIHIEKTRV